MCTGLELAAYAGAASAAVGVYQGQEARHDAKVERNRIASDRIKAETEAAQRASAQTQMARRALAKNSLFTGGGADAGRTTLGVG